MKKIAILGTGMIGASLATLFVGNGFETILVGRKEERCQEAAKEVAKNLDDLIGEGLMTPKQKQAALKYLQTTVDYGEIRDADFCYEAVLEDVAVKGEVYAKAEQVLRADVVLASATSALSAEVLSALVEHKERFLVAHPWNPPHLVPLVEVVGSSHTSQAALEAAKHLIDQTGHKAVVLRKNIEGFIGNRLQHAMTREALYLVEQGVASAEDINDVIYYSFGQRYSSIGLFEHYDCAGLPLQKQVQATVFPTLCNDAGPQQILLDTIGEGKLGMKTGEGILDWSKRDLDDFRRRQREPFYRFVNWNFPEEE